MSEHKQKSVGLQYFKCIALLLMSLMLAQLTVWREMDEFWLSASEYPIWLRDFVHFTFYPYLFFVFFTAVILSLSVVREFFKRLRVYGHELILAFDWIIILASLALMLANNIASLFER